MNAYGIVIHQNMIQNTVETDVKEAAGLFNTTLVIYVVILGIIPSLLLLKVKLEFGSIKQEIWQKLKLWAIILVSIVALIAPLTADYASFFRNNKNIRQMANPANFIYASISYASASNKSIHVKAIGEDAKLNPKAATHSKPTLFVLVVGETARADHFSINGYNKPTTPLIAQQDIINYRNVFSCGTETAVSVPCMFSNLTRDKYSDKKAKSQEGLLDILKRSGYSVLWRDNNSSCKGTCDRVDYEPMKDLKISAYCNDRECFDNILLHEIDSKISAMNGNKVIVLHPKGSHGPDYYNRYPENMEVFKPVCKVNKLQDCTSEEINNAFDNTIHMTDQFLNNTIEWLKTQSTNYNTAMIYLSDHGESLGENNLYLHGMPYLIAPNEQKHVPFFFWFSRGFEQENSINRQCLSDQTNTEYSHDNLFHTTLGLLNVDTGLYKPELDMTSQCRK
ncbi:phosphoethanolamine transferase [Cellvibrio zantedeschiae]|uniref:Phosphoethanolamine transferase n=2 Tax=Cellvibrio zantedeschiae TaxID=1237077 RepID=A0ABQ3ASI5_9GAMM|nr:phosphoethanolamine transferase [Cellvibrio zantedeschiae]